MQRRRSNDANENDDDIVVNVMDNNVEKNKEMMARFYLKKKNSVLPRADRIVEQQIFTALDDKWRNIKRSLVDLPKLPHEQLNLSRDSRLAMNRLRNHATVIVILADKNRGFVVIDRELYNRKVIEFLEDKSCYEEILQDHALNLTPQQIVLDRWRSWMKLLRIAVLRAAPSDFLPFSEVEYLLQMQLPRQNGRAFSLPESAVPFPIRTRRWTLHRSRYSTDC